MIDGVAPDELWTRWDAPAAPILLLVLAGVLYARGVARSRGDVPKRRAVIAFYAGLAMTAVALVSPLDALSRSLFSAHMVQHLLLILVAPPLVAYGRPALVMLRGLGRPVGARLARLTKLGPVPWARKLSAAALVVWAINTAVVWAWHLPVLYTAALAQSPLHIFEHASFFLSAFLFWRLVITSRARRSYPQSVGLVFGTALQSGALGAVLAFATVVLYPVHRAGARLWGLDPLSDQQLAGAIMWVPPGVIYLVTMIVLLARWFSEMEPARPPDPGARASSVPAAGDG